MTRQVISFHYTLKDTDGKLLDSSEENQPLAFLQGSGHIIPGLEEVLIAMKPGEKREVKVPYQKAYGAYDQTLVYNVTRSNFPNQDKINIGDMFQVGEGDQYQIVTVVDVSAQDIVVDANHPLAGKDLVFNVEIAEMRPATTEELSHGHAHGPHGHEH